MVTYLDSMDLSSFLLLASTHLWFMHLKTRRLRFALSACLAGIALTLTRTSLQPIFFAVIIVLAYLVVRQTVSTHARKKLSDWCVICLLLTLASPIKQFALFGTFSSTSSGGHHLLGTIRYLPTEQELAEIDAPSRILENANELVSDYNVPEEVITNFRYSQLFSPASRRNRSLVYESLSFQQSDQSSQALGRHRRIGETCS